MNPLPQGNDIFTVLVKDAKTMILFGRCGTILQTEDGGEKWSMLRPDSSATLDPGKLSDFDLNNIYRRSDGTIIAFDSLGLHLTSTDDGVSWRGPDKPIDQPINAYDVNDQVVIAAGEWIYRSTDGGSSWRHLPVSLNSVFIYRVVYAGTDVWVALNHNGALFRSTDNGITWSELPSRLSIYSPSDGYLRFNGSGVGLARRYRTTDRGGTWSAAGQEFVGLMSDAMFLDDTTALTYGDSGRIYRSIDAGASWAATATPPGKRLNAMGVVDGVLIAVGDEGTIFRSTDRGAVWQSVESPTDQNITSLTFGDNGFGVAVGLNGCIIRTTDAGITWSNLAPGFRTTLYEVDFADDQVGYILGLRILGINNSRGVLRRTTDGGASWTELPMDDSILLGRGGSGSCIAFYDAMHGYGALGSDIYRTVDGGISWTVKRFDKKTIYDIAIIDRLTAVAVGGDGFITRTTDGGETWNQYENVSQYINFGVSFKGNFGLAVGNGATIYRTLNEGASWTLVPRSELGGLLPALKAVVVVDSVTAFVAAETEAVYRTTDRGKNWTRLKLPKRSDNYLLRSIDFAGDVGVVVGSAGTVFRTTDNGATWSNPGIDVDSDLWEVSRMGSSGMIAVGEGGMILGTGVSLQPLSVPETRGSEEPATSLIRPVPNPTTQALQFMISLPESVPVRLMLSTPDGRLVGTVFDGELPAGSRSIEWDAADLANGLYFYRLEVGAGSQRRVETGRVVIER